MYQFDSRVRYSEVDRNKNLTLPAIINYFQDCSTFHSEAVNLGLEYMEREKKVWVISFWQIIIDRFPRFCDEITVQTWPYNFKGFMGSRNFTMLDGAGERIISANSLWSFLDLAANRPAKIAPEQIAGYPTETPLPLEYADRKIPLVGEEEEKDRIQVVGHHLDTNNHVNNGQYIQMAYEFLPPDFCLRQMRAEYKKQAVLHDVLTPWVHIQRSTPQGKGNCTVALCDEKKQPYAIVAFDE